MNRGRLIPITGVMILFIGVGIHPAFAVDYTKSIVNNTSEEDCNCEGFDDKLLVVLENQLQRFERFSKLLLVLSKYNPELIELNKELLDISDSRLFWDFPIICDILLDIYLKMEDLVSYFVELSKNTTNLLVQFISTYTGLVCLIIYASTGEIMDALGCENIP